MVKRYFWFYVLVLIAILIGAANYASAQRTPPFDDWTTGPVAVSLAPSTALVVSTGGMPTVRIGVSGTFTGLFFKPQGTVDGANWFDISSYNDAAAYPRNNPGGLVDGLSPLIVPSGGLLYVRVNITALATGTANFMLRAGAGTPPVAYASGAGGGGGGAVNLQGATSGGNSLARYLAAASANQDQHTYVSGTHQLYSLDCYNLTGTANRFVKIYDLAAPTSASTPLLTMPLPWGTTNIGGVNKVYMAGVPFVTAISSRFTTGMADNDTGAVTAGDVYCTAEYK